MVSGPELLRRYKLLVIAGPERSACARALAELHGGSDRAVLDLADRVVLRAAREDPAALLVRRPVAVLGAERLPGLVGVGRAHARRPGEVVLVSAVRPERLGPDDGLLEVLPGPAVPGLPWPRLLAAADAEAMVAALGGLRPAARPEELAARGFLAPGRARRLLEDILGTIEESVQRIARPKALERLAAALLARSGEPIDLATAARAAELPFETARRYLGVLVAGYAVSLVPADGSGGQRSPLVLPVDPAVAAAAGGLAGAGLVRTWALLAVVRTAEAGAALSHWRTRGGARIDLSLAGPSATLGVVLRARPVADRRELRGLGPWLGADPGRRALVLASGETVARVLGPRIATAPLGLLGAEPARPSDRQRPRPAAGADEPRELPAELL